MTSAPGIMLTDVSAGYGKNAVLHGVTLQIGRGEMVGVLGPNGAGKSTLLKVMTGYVPVISGEVYLGGKPIAELRPHQRAAHSAVVPQAVETPMSYTVEEMVQIGRTARLGRFGGIGAVDAQSIERAMAYTDVIDLRDRPFSELSGGEKQRAVVAMALAQESSCIFLDEATSNLDMNHRLEILEIVERLNTEDGKTVVMVSHDLNLVAEFCRRVILMERGRIVADGSPGEVMQEHILSRIYNCRVRVQLSEGDGGLTVAPARRIAKSALGKGRHIHIVAGGGSGETLMRRLVLSGYRVTCGVLNKGDSDAQTAAGLGLECVLEKPFSPLGQQAINMALTALEGAHALVVCGVPFGPGNLANMALARAVMEKGRPVYLMDGVGDRDYTADKQAAKMAAAMLAEGAVVWSSVAELTDRLASDL